MASKMPAKGAPHTSDICAPASFASAASADAGARAKAKPTSTTQVRVIKAVSRKGRPEGRITSKVKMRTSRPGAASCCDTPDAHRVTGDHDQERARGAQYGRSLSA